jgi:hypothetical protein
LTWLGACVNARVCECAWLQVDQLGGTLSHLHRVWRYGDASRGEEERKLIDQQGSRIVACLLKVLPIPSHPIRHITSHRISPHLVSPHLTLSYRIAPHLVSRHRTSSHAVPPSRPQGVSIGTEVSESCRHAAIAAVETLAVCYADELAPNNELAITALLTHAFGVLTNLARGRPRDATAAAASAVAFLSRNGSALAERLVDLFKEWVRPHVHHAPSPSCTLQPLPRTLTLALLTVALAPNSHRKSALGKSATAHMPLPMCAHCPARVLALYEVTWPADTWRWMARGTMDGTWCVMARGRWSLGWRRPTRPTPPPPPPRSRIRRARRAPKTRASAPPRWAPRRHPSSTGVAVPDYDRTAPSLVPPPGTHRPSPTPRPRSTLAGSRGGSLGASGFAIAAGGVGEKGERVLGAGAGAGAPSGVGVGGGSVGSGGASARELAEEVPGADRTSALLA